MSWRTRLEAQRPELLRLLQEPNLTGVRAFVCLLDGCLAEISGDPGDDPRAALVISAALQASYPALVRYRRGDVEGTARWIKRNWIEQAAVFGVPAFGALEKDPPPAEPDGKDLEFLAAFNVAVSELFASRLKDAQARLILRRLMTYLGLSLDNLARMFDVTGDTARLWEKGKGEVPGSQMRDVVAADEALDRLLLLFRPERLHQVVRRKADLFDHEPALEWILRGRLGDVAGRYEAVLGYQG